MARMTQLLMPLALLLTAGCASNHSNHQSDSQPESAMEEASQNMPTSQQSEAQLNQVVQAWQQERQQLRQVISAAARQHQAESGDQCHASASKPRALRFVKDAVLQSLASECKYTFTWLNSKGAHSPSNH